MFAEEWPLMMFTLISQLAIGMFSILFLVRQLLQKESRKLASDITNVGFLAVGIVMMVALFCAVFHLGSPLGGYRSILNLKTSWLSREIIAANAFGGLWFVSFLAYRKGKESIALPLLTIAAGLLLVFSTASIYSHSVRPAWMNVNTFIVFYGATFSLGSFGTAVIVFFQAARSGQLSQVMAALRKVSLISVAAVVIPLIYFPVYITGLAAESSVGARSAQILLGDYGMLLGARIATLLAAASLLLWALRKGEAMLSPNWIYTAFVLSLIGEFLGRYTFYGSGISISIGL